MSNWSDLKQHQYKQKLYTQQAISYKVSFSTVSSSHFTFFHLLPLPAHQVHLTVECTPTGTLTGIIRGGAVLSPVSSARPCLSSASDRPRKLLSLTLTLSSCPGSIALPLTPRCIPFRLPWPSGSCSCHPSIQPTSPLLLLHFKFSTPTLDLAPGLSPRPPCLCCPQHGWTYPRARCGPMWPACPEYRLSAVIAAIDFYPNLLPWGDEESEKQSRKERVRVDWAKEEADEWGEK